MAIHCSKNIFVHLFLQQLRWWPKARLTIWQGCIFRSTSDNVSSHDECFFSPEITLPPVSCVPVSWQTSWLRLHSLPFALSALHGYQYVSFHILHVLHESWSSTSSLANCLYSLNVEHLNPKFSERIKITPCMWPVVWKLKSSLPRRPFEFSGGVSSTELHMWIKDWTAKRGKQKKKSLHWWL